MRNIKMKGRKFSAGVVITALVILTGYLLLPVEQVSAGWLDNAIKQGVEELIKPAPSSDNTGQQAGNMCANVLYMDYWARSACRFGGNLVDKLNEEDQKYLAESTEETIATDRNTSWSNQNSGVEGDVRITGTRVQSGTSDVDVQQSVQIVPPLDLIGGEFVAVQGASIYSGPGSDYSTLAYISNGQTVHVIAKVQDQPWYLVSQDGVGSGYIYSEYFKPTGRIKTRGVQQQQAKPPKQNVKRVRVQTKQKCKTVEQKVKMRDGTTHKNSVEACPEPDGTWDVALFELYNTETSG